MKRKLAILAVVATLATSVLACGDGNGDAGWKGKAAVAACKIACESSHEGNQGRIDKCVEECETLLVPTE